MSNVSQIHMVMYFKNTSRVVDGTGDVVAMVPVVTVVSEVVLEMTLVSWVSLVILEVELRISEQRKYQKAC